ncbi:MAG TPA: hypothetical protein VIR03_02270 [Candidatus Saccharimonadales bacterium]
MPNFEREVHLLTPSTGGGYTHEYANPALQNQINETLTGWQRTILERFPSNDAGLDIARVHSFIGRYGLRGATLVNTDARNMPHVYRTVYDVTGIQSRGPSAGMYYAEIDTAFVVRDPKLEAYNGPGFTESLGIHELAHGSSEYATIRAARGEHGSTSLVAPRIGQSILKFGAEHIPPFFLEEGLAEYLSGVYVAEDLGLQGGFSELPWPVTWVNDKSGQLPLQSRYSFRRSRRANQPSFSYSAFAATAIGFMQASNPQLFPALLRARHDAAGLREVAKIIDAFQPGLYRELRDSYNDEELFSSGLRRVMSALDIPAQTR